MTVTDLITASLRAIGVLASGETPSAADQTEAFNVLNDMLDSWLGESLTIYATNRSTYPMTVGLNPHTIGTEGSPTFNATRPIKIDRASVIPLNAPTSEIPLIMLSDAEWQEQQGKQVLGIAFKLWVRMSYPLVELWTYPVAQETDTLVLYTPQQIGRFASVFTTFDLPPGYSRALKWALAKELAPEFGVTLSGEAADNASEAKSAIRRLNNKPSYLKSDRALLSGGGRFNILTGDY